MNDAAAPRPPAPATNRLPALDRLRGIAVIGMILVNNPGDMFAAPHQIQHAGWYGLTFADVVAPAFLWVVGFALELSLARRLARASAVALGAAAAAGAAVTPRRATAAARRSWVVHVCRRVAVLFVIGVFLSLWFRLFPAPSLDALAEMPLLGILQRIGLAYGLAAVLLGTGRSPLPAALVLLAGYTAAMLVGAHFSPAAAFAEPTNLAMRLDRLLLGAHATRVHTALTIFPGAATVLLGAALGRSMRTAAVRRPSLRMAALHGVLPLAAGLCLAIVIPVTRYLWSPSFALLTAGITAISFSLLSLVEVGGGAADPARDPLAAVGANPLLLFVLSELARRPLEAFGAGFGGLPWRSFQRAAYEALTGGLSAPLASLVYSVIYLVPFLLLALYLARRRIFVKI
jgi:predicted acyltransferase